MNFQMRYRLETNALINSNMNKLISILILLIFSVAGVSAQGIPSRPTPPRLVNDMANIIEDKSEARMERTLVSFDNSTSTQIAVVTVDDLQGYDIADFAIRLGEAWGVGSEKNNNGIVVLVKPKTASSNGQAFIAVGYGLEDVVPDAIAKRIVEYEMIPQFKNNDMTSGIYAAVNTLTEITSGKYTAEQYKEKTSDGPSFLGFLFFLLIFIVLPIFSKVGTISSGRGAGLFALLALLSRGSSHSGSFSNFNSGSGGFGGFGGGSFGGGGAGGSW